MHRPLGLPEALDTSARLVVPRMTARIDPDPPRNAGNDWMFDAKCVPDGRWTPDLKPAVAVLDELRGICHTCPVMAQCARYALDQGAHGGVYAGVWVPHRNGGEWLDARRHLFNKTVPLVPILEARPGAQQTAGHRVKNPMTRRENTVELHQRIADLTHLGLTVPAIAERLHVNERTVSRGRNSTGTSGPVTEPMTPKDLRWAHAALQDGASYTEVAETLGRAESTIKRRFPGYTWTAAQRAEAANMARRLNQLGSRQPNGWAR